MEIVKNIFFWNLNLIPFGMLKDIQRHKLMLPLYHIVSDERVPHIDHLYPYKKIDQFKDDLNFFLKHFNPISLHDLMQNVRNKKEFQQKSFLLTVDDGYREVFDIIAPILKEKSIPATFFLNSAFVDNKNMFFRNKASLLVDALQEDRNPSTLASLKEILEENFLDTNDIQQAILSIPYHQRNVLDDIAQILEVDFDLYLKEKQPYLTSEQINKLIDDGFVIGSHSIDHPLFKHLSLEEQMRQTRESFGFLEENYELPYRAFAFPHTDKHVKQFFKETHFNGDIEISFGTSGFNKGNCDTNIQRQSMEVRNESAREIYKRLFKYEVFMQLKNSGILSGKKSQNKTEDKGKLNTKSSTEKIRLEKITVEQLYDFVKKYNQNKKKEDVAVISEQRALAQSLNPYADENDIGLIVVYKGDVCVGYQGLMPGIAEIGGENEKIYYPTTWLVSDSVRGQSVGSLLFRESLGLNKVLICTGMNNNSESVLLYMGYEPMKSIFYWQIYFAKCNKRFNRTLDKFNNKIKKYGTNRHFYELCKTSNYNDILEKLKSNLKSIHFKEVDAISDEYIIPDHHKENRFIRSKEVVNWMVKNVWIQNKDQDINEKTRDYYFSNIRDIFKYITIEIYSKESKEMLGFLVLSVSKEKRQTTIKLLDFDLQHNDKYSILLSLVMQYASDYSADKVEITDEFPQSIMLEVIKPSILRKLERKYLYYMSDMSNKVALAMRTIKTNYCDGDMPFY